MPGTGEAVYLGQFIISNMSSSVSASQRSLVKAGAAHHHHASRHSTHSQASAGGESTASTDTGGALESLLMGELTGAPRESISSTDSPQQVRAGVCVASRVCSAM